MSHQATLEFLSNLTPGSELYNLTVQQLRRTKRDSNSQKHLVDNVTSSSEHHETNNKSRSTIDHLHAELDETVTNGTVHLHLNRSGHHSYGTSSNNRNGSSSITVQKSAQHFNGTLKRINSEKYWKKYKNYIKHKQHKIAPVSGISINPLQIEFPVSHNQTPVKVSHLILNNSNIDDEMCLPLMKFSLLFCVVYILFSICLLQFIFFTESAVYTVTIVSVALPVSGIFWSLFELTAKNGIGEWFFL